MNASTPQDPTALLADLDFIRGIARSLCRDAHAAEDLTQDAIASTLKTPTGRVRDRRGWLATVTRNAFRNHVRSERRRRTHEGRAATDETSVPSTDEVVAREQQRQLVVDAVLALPTTYRTVVLLRHFRGLDVPATARELGITKPTVRMRLSRAVEMLRHDLDRKHGGDRSAWLSALLPFAWPAPGASTSSAGPTTAATAKKAAAAAIVLLAVSLGLAAYAWHRPGAPTPSAVLGALPNAGSHRHQATTETGTALTPTPASRTSTTANDTPVATAAERFGQVLDGRGLPIPQALVELWAEIGSNPEAGDRIELGRVRTDGLGRCFLPLAALDDLSAPAHRQARIWANVEAASHYPELVATELATILAADPDEPAFQCYLRGGNPVVGHVRTTDGRPIDQANVFVVVGDSVETTRTYRDGSWVVDASDLLTPGDALTVFAAHDAWGISELYFAALGGTETRIEDIVVHPTRTQVEGEITLPDGQPAAEVPIRLTRVQAEPDGLGDLRLLDERLRLARSAASNQYETNTDREGRFSARALRPGRYELTVDHEMPIEIEVPRERVLHVARTTRTGTALAQLHVDVLDDHGYRLTDIWLNRHTWLGPNAAEAERRFYSEGPTASLMASADRRTAASTVDERTIDVRANSFHILEATCEGGAPAFAACRLGAGQFRADVQITLGPPPATGGLDIQVRAPSGERIDTVWFRMTTAHSFPAVPVLFPGTAAHLVPPSAIYGPWHRLPDSGRLTGVPAGLLTLELLADAFDPAAPERGPAWPVVTQQFELMPGTTQRVRARTSTGSRMAFAIDTAHRGVLQAAVTIHGPRGARRHALRAASTTLNANGEALIAHTLGLFEPGSYDVEITTSPPLHDAQGPSGNWRRTVVVGEPGPPVAVQLCAPR